MYDGKKIIPGLIIFLGLITYPLWYNAVSGKTGYVPKPKIPADKKECVEPKAYHPGQSQEPVGGLEGIGRPEGRRGSIMASNKKTYNMSSESDLHELSPGQDGILRSMPQLCRGDQ